MEESRHTRWWDKKRHVIFSNLVSFSPVSRRVLGGGGKCSSLGPKRRDETQCDVKSIAGFLRGLHGRGDKAAQRVAEEQTMKHLNAKIAKDIPQSPSSLWHCSCRV
eukprot:2126272-Amphidinium_carterae.1